MACAKLSLATPVFALVALMHSSAAPAVQDAPYDAPASGPPFYPGITEVILLASLNEPWQETHSLFARWIGRPITTWSVQNEAFILNFKMVFFRGKKPLFFTVHTSEIPSARKILGVRWFTCSAKFLVLDKPDIRTLSHNTRLMPPRAGCEAGYLTVNDTFIQSFFWPQESSSNQNAGSKKTLGLSRPLNRYSVQGLGGRELTVMCRKRLQYEGIENTCDDASVLGILTLLNRRNVTFKRVESYNITMVESELRGYTTDIALFRLSLHDRLTLFFEFPLIRIVQDTLYSRVDAQRAVSLLEVAGECWKLLTATVTLLALVVLVTVVSGHPARSISRHISTTSLFLLAAVLATSAVQPKVAGRAGIVRKALLGLWLAALLPLSVYFRTELTAIVTLRRPAYRIDTLKKLEDALDRRQVAPCVAKNTLNHLELCSNVTSLPLQSLSKKLRLAFARHGKELVTRNLSHCIECASRPDRVCYDGPWRHPSSALLKHRNVREFSEHLKIQLIGFAMPKLYLLYWPLRRFFLAVEEHKLIDWHSSEPEFDNAETEFDMSGLLQLLVILNAMCCLVLVLEVVVARHMRRA